MDPDSRGMLITTERETIETTKTMRTTERIESLMQEVTKISEALVERD